MKKNSPSKAGKEVAEPVRHPHYFLGEDLFTPNVNKCDGSRLNMFISHGAQLLELDTAETPKVFTRFENQIGKYSRGMGYTKLEEDVTFLGRVDFNENDAYIFFLYPDDSVGIFHHTSTTRLTENYGHRNVLRMPEDLDMGDSVPSGTLLSRSNMYTDELDLKIGVNLKALYLAKDGLTFEDGVILSESGSKKFRHNSVTEAVITVNNNDVLINWMGSKGSLQQFPQIGEEIKSKILAVRRRINYNTILTDFNQNDSTIESTDTCFFFDGVVENIEVFSNFSEKDLAYSYNEPIRLLVEHNKAKYKELEDMITEFKANGWTLRDDTGYLYQKAKDYNSGVKFSHERSEFEGAVLRFTIRKDHGIYIGSKITGRYGNKGVVSAIIPDKDMPTTEDGRVPDVVLNPLGVVGRMNVAQNFEQELNFVADEIVRKADTMPKADRDDWLMNAINEFFEILNPVQLAFLDENITTEDEVKWFLSDVRENGLRIHQPPFYGNASPDIMSKLFKHFDIKKIKFRGMAEPQIMGDLYFVQLKHEPESKFSVRSAGQVSLLNVPFKSNEQYKKGTATQNSSPIRFGEQETFNLLMLSNGVEGSTPIIDFFRHYSSHNGDRKAMITKLLRNDIKQIDTIKSQSEDRSAVTNSAQVIRSYFNGIGVTMENDNDADLSALRTTGEPEDEEED